MIKRHFFIAEIRVGQGILGEISGRQQDFTTLNSLLIQCGLRKKKFCRYNKQENESFQTVHADGSG